MEVTQEILAKAKQLSLDNYETWGQWVVECMEDKELEEDLRDFENLDDWVEIQERVGKVYEERENLWNW